MRQSGRLSAEEVEKRTRERLDRQQLLRRPEAPRSTFYPYEAALRCPMGGARVIHEQILHLLFVATQPRVRIRVVCLMGFEKFGPVA